MWLTLLNVACSLGRLSLLSCLLCVKNTFLVLGAGKKAHDLRFSVMASLNDDVTSAFGCLRLFRLSGISTTLNRR
jgi:hypothetical protein